MIDGATRHIATAVVMLSHIPRAVVSIAAPGDGAGRLAGGAPARAPRRGGQPPRFPDAGPPPLDVVERVSTSQPTASRRVTPLARPEVRRVAAAVPDRFLIPPRAAAIFAPNEATMRHVLADARLVALLEDGAVADAAARVAARPEALPAEAAANPDLRELYARLAALAARWCEEEAARG